MSSTTPQLATSRRTTADEIFDQLYSDIMALRLLPGSKLSESEIAKQQAVSRQPVREAFIKLDNKGLLDIRPQKATLVKKISIQGIRHARFIRMAVEVEVIRQACKNASEADFKLFKDNLKAQRNAARADDANAFHSLDYDFHFLICKAAQAEFAYTTIAENKSMADRLCMICLTDKKRMVELTRDHTQIFNAIKERNIERSIELTRIHLTRLDSTLNTACKEFGEYFEE